MLNSILAEIGYSTCFIKT